MRTKLEFIAVGLSVLFWPLSLLLANTPSDFLSYLLPALLVGLSFVLLSRNQRFYLAPLLFIPLVEPKLAAFPLMVAVLAFLWQREKRFLVFTLLSFLILVFTWRGFWGQTVFTPDYQAQQEVIAKTYLYPSVFLARLFQNKPRIYLGKFNHNFFALGDPNNYFFGFHPREILLDNQNLNKYPFLSIVFAFLGFYYLRKHPRWKFISILLISSALSLSLLKIFDRNDFILWVPLSLVLIHGVKTFQAKQKKKAVIFYLIFFAFTIPELFRIFLR